MTQTYAMPDLVYSLATPAGLDPARVKVLWNMVSGPLPLSQSVNIERANQLWIWSGSFFVTAAGAFNGLTLKVDGVDAGYIGFFFNQAGVHTAPPTTMLKTAYGIGSHTVSINGGANIGNDSGDRHSLLLIELENTQQLVQIAARPPVVSTLPANPEHGQEVYYKAAADTFWHLKYDSTLSDAYKWVYVGGPPLRKQVNGPRETSTWAVGAAGAMVNSGIDLIVPLTGVYDLSGGADQFSDSVTMVYLEFAIGTSGIIGGWVQSVTNAMSTTRIIHPWRFTFTSAPATIIMRHGTQANNSKVDNRWAQLTPVRVG